MFKLLLIASVVHSISLVNPDFKLVNNLISSSFIASVAFVGAAVFPPSNFTPIY